MRLQMALAFVDKGAEYCSLIASLMSSILPVSSCRSFSPLAFERDQNLVTF